SAFVDGGSRRGSSATGAGGTTGGAGCMAMAPSDLESLRGALASCSAAVRRRRAAKIPTPPQPAHRTNTPPRIARTRHALLRFVPGGVAAGFEGDAFFRGEEGVGSSRLKSKGLGAGAGLTGGLGGGAGRRAATGDGVAAGFGGGAFFRAGAGA